MKEAVKLLWTGGADSTFRLMELLLIQKRSVQPYYLIDKTRKSLEFEVKAMQKILQLIRQRNPEVGQLMHPTIFIPLNEIRIHSELAGKYRRLKQMDHLGTQYEWLSSFAEQWQIACLELCVTATTHFDFFSRFLKPSLIKIRDGDFYNFKLNQECKEDLNLFKYFLFPIIEKTKLEMRQVARENNFLEMMNNTWFCHSPVKAKPCGLCNPCKIAIQEGMAERITLRGRLRNFSHLRVKPFLKASLNGKEHKVVQ